MNIVINTQANHIGPVSKDITNPVKINTSRMKAVMHLQSFHLFITFTRYIISIFLLSQHSLQQFFFATPLSFPAWSAQYFLPHPWSLETLKLQCPLLYVDVLLVIIPFSMIYVVLVTEFGCIQLLNSHAPSGFSSRAAFSEWKVIWSGINL